MEIVEEASSKDAAIVGSLLGTAVGDALGLPYEGLSRRRGAKLFGEPDRYRLLPGRGMVSDDTEHACMVAQAVIDAGDDAEAFAEHLARRLRWWLLALPAGTGLATLKATLKLCIGISPDRSGIFSAGNGPAMRSPILGAAIDDLDQLRRFVRASTRITHTDLKAEYGAWGVALAARRASSRTLMEPRDYASELSQSLAGEPADEFLDLVDRAVRSHERGESVEAFADSLGLEKGVSGYVYHTVLVVLHAWFSYPGDFRSAVQSVIRCGGDTDSTAAIVGGIVGCTVSKAGIPQEWLDHLWEWPRSVTWLEHLGKILAASRSTGQPE
ncbi:MAG: ADP-ribosylglycohydrolase family protein, partial [Planctomycetaceae bacterium]|nr:ADP-ribosylglycohydrolase family protein [Planctomycetaceae bacterium]